MLGGGGGGLAFTTGVLHALSLEVWLSTLGM
jgi:hypothetical protein